jgi:hypothetical protein
MQAAIGYYSKRAIKGTGGPIGGPMPVRWIDCECGRCVPVDGQVDTTITADANCECGLVYDGRGFILNR